MAFEQGTSGAEFGENLVIGHGRRCSFQARPVGQRAIDRAATSFNSLHFAANPC
jgi:hypothetical protein